MTVIKPIHLTPEERRIHPQAISLTAGQERRQGVKRQPSAARGGSARAGGLPGKAAQRIGARGPSGYPCPIRVLLWLPCGTEVLVAHALPQA